MTINDQELICDYITRVLFVSFTSRCVFYEMHVSHKINGLVVTHFPFRKYAFVARKSRKEGGRGDIEGEESAQSNKVSLVTGGEKSGCF